ncbi:MAG: DUF2550 domain-containing protein [Hamadaea sp.]|nr:DUF2550 domain-containing protein [Hamadaea sp.]NUR52184.1 DUF2550 domain-containing protein [Hamadaea sp.]NUR74540.1 DUF2550 domain-containing protein [Hamadaea sp.]NUT07920.1 DUF2550 domain-containing protein [Hamadaea sp.]
MGILKAIAVGLIVVFLLLATLFLRREWFARRGGTVEIYMRLGMMVEGRGWAPGFARFAGDELRWYRMFSFSPRPRRILRRRDLSLVGRRTPSSAEQVLVPAEWVVVRLLRPTRTVQPDPLPDDKLVEIAMSPTVVTGFLSWYESAPPGPSHLT